MGMKHARTAALVVALAMAAPGEARAQDDRGRFGLFAACKPIAVLVEDPPPGALELGLTRAGLHTAVEGRLRAAQLYNTDPYSTPLLYLAARVSGAAASVRLELHKDVLELESGITGAAPTWWSGGHGEHGGQPGTILNTVAHYVDEFLAEYLRVNFADCQ